MRRDPVPRRRLTRSISAPDDQHILAKTAGGDRETAPRTLEKYRFNDAALALYEFVWHQFCDWYVEYAKEALYGEDHGRQGARHAA